MRRKNDTESEIRQVLLKYCTKSTFRKEDVDFIFSSLDFNKATSDLAELFEKRRLYACDVQHYGG